MSTPVDEMPCMNLLAQLDSAQASGWWWTALTSGPAMWLSGIGVVCVLLIFWLGWRLRVLSAQTRRASVRQRLADDTGVAMMEFVLVTPILLFVTLLLIQTVLVYTGLFYVQYAAFAAARSAIVQIPSSSTEPSNELLPERGSDKFDAIESAAVLAVLPVSGRESGPSVAGSEIVAGLGEVFSAQGQSEPPWVDRLIADRLAYAINHTEATVERVEIRNSKTIVYEPIEDYALFSPKEAIAVHVRHEFALSVPLASRLYSAVGESGTYSPATNGSGSDDSPGPPGLWTLIESRAILTNEGIDRRLPEPTEYPRRP